MATQKTYDLFITHAWRYHDDWKRLCNALNQHDSRGWRNFSLPWFDPALKPGSEFGGKILRENLEAQIIPAQAVILLASVFAQPSSRKWLDPEIEISHKHGKHIIALPVWGESDVSREVRQIADEVVGWDVRSLLEAVDRVSGRAPAAQQTPSDPASGR